MKTFRKALSIILGIAMMLSCVAGMQVSATEGNTIELTVGEAKVENGVVTVPVIATGSIQALTATVAYDNALDLVGAEKTAIVEEGVDKAVFGPTDAETFKMQWAFALTNENVVLDNTTIATLTFNVVDTTAETANINLEITEAWDVDGNAVTATANDGTVEFVKECAHVWGDWVITQPTKTETGLKVRTCTVCNEATEEVVIPAAQLEEGIEFRNSIMAVAETFQIDFRVRKSVIDALETQYASYKLVVTPQKYNADTLNEETGKPVVLDFALSGKTNYIGTYTDIAMYELGLDLNAYLECYDADGIFVAYSNVYTENPVTLFKGLITDGATAGSDAYKMNVAVTDALNLAAQAQDYFPSLIGSKTCDLYTATRVNEGLDQQYATPTLTSDMLTVVDITNKCNVVYNPDSAIAAATNELRLGGAMGAAPSITYDLRQATATGSSPLDYSKLSMTVSYMRATDTIEGAEWENYVAKKHLSYTFEGLAMYDADKVVTCVVTYDGVEAVTATYTLETFINQYKDDANMGTIITALGKFTTSVRAYFGA